ncbi:MAG: hypothetical protein ACTSYI_15090 [Promethearchaeota archaeon]
MEMPIDSTGDITDNTEVTDLAKLDTALDLLGGAEANITGMLLGLKKVIFSVREDVNRTESEKVKLKHQKILLERKSRDQKKEISSLNNEQMQLLNEYAQIKEELEKFTQIATSEGGTIRIDDMRATLVIYRKLLEEIFAAKAHFKILFLLHGDSEIMDLESLKGATGIGGAVILRACHELKKANLITFDPDSKKCELTKRFFPKPNKK